MTRLTHIRTDAIATAPHTGAVRDLIAGPGGTLLSITAAGEVTVQRADLGLVQRATLPADARALPGEMGLQVVRMGGQDVLLAHGRADALHGWTLGADGRLSDARVWDLPGAGAVLDAQTVQVGGRTMVYTAGRGDGGVEAWVLGETRAQRVQDLGLSAAGGAPGSGSGGDVFALHRVMLDGRAHLLAASSGDGTLSTLRLEDDGRMTLVAQTGLRDGLPIATPTQVGTVTVDGVSYVVVGAAGSSSVSVLRLAADGTLVAVDQVGDDRDTRFQGVSVLETVTLDGRAYVIAGGADDGLTVMEVLPGGRLLHRATIADDMDMVLTGPGALSVAVRAGGIDITVTGSGTEGVTRLHFAPGGPAGEVLRAGDGGARLTGTAGDDTLIGGAGDDLIEGGAGDDVLIDGAGSDTLRGGPGADVFILSPDGHNDTIEGFEIGIDRLDLSRMGTFYTVDAVQMGPRWNGILIRFGTEELRLRSEDWGPLFASDFDIADLRDLWHIDVAPEAPVALSLTGGRGADTLLGGAGDDVILGGGTDARFDPVSAQVFRLYQATLGRDPDPVGHLNWTARLMDGEVTPQAAAARFVASAEFQMRYGATDTEGFVTLLYANVLGRTPDAGGLAGWSAQIDSGTMTRAQVVLGFAESREFGRATQTDALMLSREGLAMGWSDDVFRLYQATLGRAPDLGGFQGWSGRLGDGADYTDVIGGFVGSAEFQMRYGATTDGGFVTLLYANVLGRAPDAGGFAAWTGQLASGGQSRAQVVAGFAQSREFRAATEDALTAWMRGPGADDVLSGGQGDDILFGGRLSDTFVFGPDDAGRKDVVGLERWDLLDFTGFGLRDVAEVRGQFRQVGEDVQLRAGDLSVVLHDTALADLHTDMFLI